MTDAHEAAVENFLKLAELEFTSRGLLRQALMHRSYVHEDEASSAATEGNEELEFLGDAVVGLFVVERLFQLSQRDGLSVGTVAKLKSWVVSAEVLAKCSRQLELPGCVLLGRGEDCSGGRRREALLADVMEAVIGAYYLDQGVDKARAFVMRLLGPHIEQSLATSHFSDYKSLLQCYVQRECGGLPSYQVVEAGGPEHQKSFVAEVRFGQQCQGRGVGQSKKQAEKAAARAACERLGVVDETA